jgi:hypothetical protein
MSVPHIPQWETETSISVALKGLGVKVVNVRGLVALCATQPLNVSEVDVVVGDIVYDAFELSV